MLTRVLVVAVSLSLVPGLLPAQGRRGQMNREELQRRIVEMFVGNYREQAGLSEEQFTRFQEEIQEAFQWRREHQRSERELWQALEDQLRPGVAANPDSLTQLMGAITDSRIQLQQRVLAELEGYSDFLNPVQRALLMVEWERFQRRIDRIRMGREGMGRGPGMGGDSGGPPLF